MAKRGQAFGHNRERLVKKMWEEAGWFVIRAPGSLGFCDLVCLKAEEKPVMLEVKATADGPYRNFGPADRAALLQAAEQAGAIPALCWWPAHKPPTTLQAHEWPS